MTTPGRCAVISFSIFIASTTQMTWPSRTSSPSPTSTASTVPCIGLTTASRAAACRPAVPGPLAAAPRELRVGRLRSEDRRPRSAGRPARRRRAPPGPQPPIPLARRGASLRGLLRDRLDEPEARLAGDEARVVEERAVEAHERRDALDRVLAERAQHPPARPLAVGVPDDDLGDERVVEPDDLRALRDPAVDPHPRARGLAVGGDRPGRRQEPVRRVLGVDAALDRVPGEPHVLLRERERLAGGDQDLLAHEIDAR